MTTVPFADPVCVFLAIQLFNFLAIELFSFLRERRRRKPARKTSTNHPYNCPLKRL